MKSFWLFRTNLTPLEYYHSFKDLETFKKQSHDFYLLQGIWFLENNIFDEVIIWRLKPKFEVSDIVFDVGGKKFIQKFVGNFSECFKYQSPSISFFRGGFPEYDEVVKINPKIFGLKLYLGAIGKRNFPIHSNLYDRFLTETQSDLSGRPNEKVIPFYKTANPEIFRPLDLQKKYDICWICNWQIRKGREFFVNEISKSKFLKGLTVCHVGDKSDQLANLCGKHNVSNIKFLGSLERPDVNKVLNESKFGLMTSDLMDGCPRVITEVMMSGTPLLIRSLTRLLNFYKRFGVVTFYENEVEKQFERAFKSFDRLNSDAKINVSSLTMRTICEKNLEVWFQKTRGSNN